MAAISHILDACALIAYLRREPGAEVVIDVLTRYPDSCAVHAVNACEVYYDALRVGGVTVAADVFAIWEKLSLTVRRDLDDAFLQEVGRFKVAHRVSLADAFAVALAVRTGARLVSSDHHEFDPLAEAKVCDLLFIR